MAGPQRVFDGMHVFVSGAGLLPIMQTGSGPASSANGTPSFINPDMPSVHDGLLKVGDITEIWRTQTQSQCSLMAKEKFQVKHRAIRAL